MLLRLCHGGAFARQAERKLLIVFERRRISYTQVYPFLVYARSFAERHGADISLVATEDALKGFSRHHLEATHVLVQTWLTDPPERLAALLQRLDDLPRSTRRIYLDSFANSDIRLASHLESFSLYFKKSLLVSPTDMTRVTEGHTTLTEFYGRLYGLPQTPTDWQVPPAFLDRLRLAPNFLTGPGFLETFLGPPPPPQAGREIDLHARLGGSGEDNWYGAMRRDAEVRVAGLSDLRSITGTGVPRPVFLDELRRARVCFSPFGYGELCWRDIEAFMTGSVLLKPDMSHLRTEPDLYRDGETYVAVKWDFSDFEEKLRMLLENRDLRDRIAHTAWQRAQDYLSGAGPVQSYADILS